MVPPEPQPADGPLKASVQIAVLVAFGLALLLVGKRWGAAGVQPVVRTDTVWVDRPIAVRDTVTKEVPVETVVYRTVTETDTVYVAVPRDFEFTGLVGRRPVRFSSDRLVLTYWSPTLSAYVQDRYVLPRRNWEAYGAARIGIVGESLGLELGLRYRGVGLFAAADAYRDRAQITAGIRLLAFHWTR